MWYDRLSARPWGEAWPPPSIPSLRLTNQFEAWARSLCQFVIRALILPVTLVFVKPASILRAVETGEYRPLPSPFLLALITGIILSGVTSNVPKLFTTTRTADGATQDANTAFLSGVLDFYGNLSGIDTILFAIPYILVLWLFSGLISLFMLRGIKTAEALMTALSLSLSALIELVIIFAVVGMAMASLFEVDLTAAVTGGSVNDMIWPMVGALGLYTLLLAYKLIRLLFVIQKERKSPMIGAIFAIAPVLLVLTLAGLLGAGATIAGPLLVQQAVEREAFNEQMARDQAAANARTTGLEAMARRDYAAAATAYDDMLLYTQEGSAYNSACWARAVWGRDLETGLYYCNTSLQIEEGNRFTLDSRALIHLKMGDLDAALADYNAAIAAEPNYAHALYGRGVVKLWMGQTAEGEADIAAAQSLEPSVAEAFSQYGVERDRAASTLMGRPPAPAAADPRVTFAPAAAPADPAAAPAP